MHVDSFSLKCFPEINERVQGFKAQARDCFCVLKCVHVSICKLPLAYLPAAHLR